MVGLSDNKPLTKSVCGLLEYAPFVATLTSEATDGLPDGRTTTRESMRATSNVPDVIMDAPKFGICDVVILPAKSEKLI